eukprot:scaffold1757_cov208-Chaetoceros_neogracile.AAC.5
MPLVFIFDPREVRTTCTQAIKNWEAKTGTKAEDANDIKLCAQVPPLAKIDKTFATLKQCKTLSLSTNTIDRMGSLAGMTKLRILSLGRNQIKKIEKLEDVALTLEQLWISYNQIFSLEGLACCKKLTTLYMSNNAIKSFNELNHLAPLSSLKDVLFIGNPMYDEAADKYEARLRVLARLPQVTKIDGELVKPSEVEASRLYFED